MKCNVLETPRPLTMRECSRPLQYYFERTETYPHQQNWFASDMGPTIVHRNDNIMNYVCRPANLENVFRGTFRVKKRDLPAKSGTVGRAHIEIFLEVGETGASCYNFHSNSIFHKNMQARDYFLT